VILVVEENYGFSTVINPTNPPMPYLNSLAQRYALATQYFANTHPSIGNYFELTTGQIITNDDSYSNTVSVDNIVRHLVKAGKTWKEYSESMETESKKLLSELQKKTPNPDEIKKIATRLTASCNTCHSEIRDD